jgi:hypothetical protein
VNTSPSPGEVQRKSIGLSRLATIFAVSFGIAFGLCAVSAIGVVGTYQKLGTGLIWISVAVEGVCLIGLLATAAAAIIRRLK